MDEGRFESAMWDLSGMIKVLKESVTLLQRDRKYELCLEINHLLLMIYKHDKNFSAMIQWADQTRDFCQQLVSMVTFSSVPIFLMIIIVDKRRKTSFFKILSSDFLWKIISTK
jgi:hypothetical protein